MKMNKILILTVLLVLCQLTFGDEIPECNKGSECGQDECCLSNFQPIGRRRRQVGDDGDDGDSFFYGRCAKKPLLNERCIDLANPNVNYDNQTVFACPCRTGSTCVRDANPVFIAPIGYQGTCS